MQYKETILEAFVSYTENLPTELIVKHIPACRYNEYRSEGN